MHDPLRIRRQRALLWLTAGLFGLWTLWTTVVLPTLPEAVATSPVTGIAVRLLLWVTPCSVYLWKWDRSLHLGRLAWFPPDLRSWLFVFGTCAAVAWVLTLDVARSLESNPVQVWRLLFNHHLELPWAEFLEELVFRGVLLAELVELSVPSDHPISSAAFRLRFWMANVITSLAFAGLHWPWWIYQEGISSLLLQRSAGVFLLSLVLGVVFVRARSIWPCVALHWLNNALSALVPH